MLSLISINNIEINYNKKTVVLFKHTSNKFRNLTQFRIHFNQFIIKHKKKDILKYLTFLSTTSQSNLILYYDNIWISFRRHLLLFLFIFLPFLTYLFKFFFFWGIFLLFRHKNKWVRFLSLFLFSACFVLFFEFTFLFIL